MPPSDHLPRDSEKTVAPDASDQGRIVGNDRQARGVEQFVLDEYPSHIQKQLDIELKVAEEKLRLSKQTRIFRWIIVPLAMSISIAPLFMLGCAIYFPSGMSCLCPSKMSSMLSESASSNAWPQSILIVGTFSSFIGIYGLVIAGLFNQARDGSNKNSVQDGVSSASKTVDAVNTLTKSGAGA